MIGICNKHGETEFKVVIDRQKGRCKLCANEAVQKTRTKRKQELLDLKGNKCKLCNYSKCSDALSFHHLDPSQKDFALDKRNLGFRSKDEVLKELDKCVLLCNNCHAEVHAGIASV